ncbi:beta-2-glycoprotein 1 [Nothobranchius furzeri]|uniref:Beta-2-glycoprotein 1 n=1 Tax=Nothobranchius furzeri TaxID=105023 RepID=A0A8C6KSW6_NOTFU|nr:beta-2-glycoprotein 1 [Nothobranchius furzeri]KAF7223841.1 beta-2-glycoprotein 1-like [Nothobranchius furzeri]
MGGVIIFILLLTSVKSQHNNVCSRPELDDNIDTSGIQRFISPGVEVALSCKQGYTPVLGPRKIVCTVSGQWTKTKFQCIPKLCPYPDPVTNGEMYYEDTTYQSMINYTCNEGYILTGSSFSVCQANGTWSSSAPLCTPVTCGLAPIPQFGLVIYSRRVRGGTVDYGMVATYSCLPPYAVFGKATAECTASGYWTETPECEMVMCPPPENIERGYVSNNNKLEYDFKEKVRYGCRGDYVLEGSLEVVCQRDGKWSEKPSCKAPCSVGIQRGRILYKGVKTWIEDFNPNVVLHKDVVSVYCMNKVMKCGYAVTTQCMDGTLNIPECFEEPNAINYTVHSNLLPSEIEQC